MVFLMKWLIKSNLTFLFEIPTLNLPNKINFTVQYSICNTDFLPTFRDFNTVPVYTESLF